jgi:hypothetical protein
MTARQSLADHGIATTIAEYGSKLRCSERVFGRGAAGVQPCVGQTVTRRNDGICASDHNTGRVAIQPEN